MKLNYYISDLRNSLSKDYANIDDRMLIELINQFRAIFIKNEFNRNRNLPSGIIQTISGIPMNLSKQLDIDFINDSSRILKSSVKLPKLIHTGIRDLVDRVWNGKVLSSNFNYVTPEQAIYAGNGKVNRKLIFTFIYNDYLYIKLKRENPNINLISNLSFRGIFENPLDLIPLTYEGYFDPLDFEYPITEAMWGQIKSNILQNAFNVIQSEENE